MKNTVAIVIVLACVGRWATAADPGAAKRRLADLQSSDTAVRAATAEALGQFGDPSAVGPLIAALKDAEPSVRREAARSLGLLRAGDAVGPLTAALGDKDTNVRFYAAYALGEIKDPASIDPLLAALGDRQWCVRDQAAWALREIHDPAIVDRLVAMLRQPEADVAHVAWLLKQLGGDGLIERLPPLLTAPSPQTRLLAVRLLGESKNAEAAGPLRAALADRDPGVRRAAVEALFAIAGEASLEAIEKLAAGEQDASVREPAEAILRRFSPEGSLVGYWSFDDGSTTVAKDATGRGSDGQIIGCTPVEGKAGRALQFGKDRYIELGKPGALPIANKPFTVTAWVKSDAPQGVVVGRGGAFCGYSLYLKDGCARFGIHRDQEGPTYVAAGKERIVGRWAHLAGVVKSDRIELYVDGRLADTIETKGYIPGNCGQGMEIGFDAGNSAAELTDSFEGVIDEVKIYQMALSEKQIAKLGK